MYNARSCCLLNCLGYQLLDLCLQLQLFAFAVQLPQVDRMLLSDA